MQSGHITTPFGRRSMTIGMLACQVECHNISADLSVDKWKLYRALCQAKSLLGVTDRALAILNALLSFYPKQDLAEGRALIVFPSNAQLSLRAHGMAEQTIRRHLAMLVGAGLLIRKDSPNGKRYARKGRAGEISDAFGFSLAPLLARSGEIQRLADQVIAERHHLQQIREQITLCRRDIGKLIDADPNLSWANITTHMHQLISEAPRRATTAQLETLLLELQELREEVAKGLETQINIQNRSGNAVQSERHIQNSELDSNLESEISYEKQETTIIAEQMISTVDTTVTTVPRKCSPDGQTGASASRRSSLSLPKAFSLDLLVQACPQISDYACGRIIRSWHDFMAAAVTVRTMLGVSTSAYEEASAVLGPENAATVVACILERGEHIHSAGGYLRHLTRRAKQGEFAIAPMLMALVRSNSASRPMTQ